MMSLLGVYAIIVYYKTAKVSVKKGKITGQEFDYDFINEQLIKINNFKLDALHWNMKQAAQIDKLMILALNNYVQISNMAKIKLHSTDTINKRIEKFKADLESFKLMSRSHAISAQKRESVTVQPKENTDIGLKGIITITNFLKGEYYLTVDEVVIKDDIVYLIEAKHTKANNLPSVNDIIDGILKLILYCNIEKLKINDQEFKFLPILKLTSGKHMNFETLTKKEKETLSCLTEESKANGFLVEIS